jgi:hypothetical protein
MGNTMTVVTGGSAEVKRFLADIEDDQKRADSKTLVDLMSRVTSKKARLWGSIVGFGDYHYKYPTGHEGDTCLVGFSPRKTALSIYLMGNYFPETEPKAKALLARLGKHSMGKACLYVKRLDDVDMDVLESLVVLSVGALRERYPDA